MSTKVMSKQSSSPPTYSPVNPKQSVFRQPVDARERYAKLQEGSVVRRIGYQHRQEHKDRIEDEVVVRRGDQVGLRGRECIDLGCLFKAFDTRRVGGWSFFRQPTCLPFIPSNMQKISTFLLTFYGTFKLICTEYADIRQSSRISRNSGKILCKKRKHKSRKISKLPMLVKFK